jgi:glycosyltransferase involved in cell wall biosynthesis
MLRAGHTFGADLDWTFFSVLTTPGKFDDEARALGATVVNSPVALDSKLSFMRHLRSAIREGSYDEIHCHHDVVSAVYLVAAMGVPLRRRIVHVHNADLHVPTGSAAKSVLLRGPMRAICLGLADRIVGISRYTLANFLDGRAPKPSRDLVLYYGIDTAPFRAPPPDRSAVRTALGLPADAKILLFVSRMVSYKNPMFVVDVLAELAKADERVFAVFVGSGPLEQAVQSRAHALGVGDRVRVLGWREDGSALMRAADLFIFPRAEEVVDGAAKEGLGLVVVEAQAAGLRALLSRGIPDDAIVLTEQCDVLPLSDGAAAWASAVRSILSRPRADARASVDAIDASRFSLRAGFDSLVALHRL